MKRIKFDILTFNRNNGICFYSKEKKEGFIISLNNHRFFSHQSGKTWVISDLKCGIAIVKSSISFADAKKN